MPSLLLSRLSLAARVAIVIVAVNLIGLAVTAWSLFTQDRDVALDRAVADWLKSTTQIGEVAQGSVKWKKADVIAEAYSTYRQNPDLGMRHFLAVTGKLETADEWAADGVDKAAFSARAVELVKTVKDAPVIDRSAPDVVVVAVPLGLDKKGQRIGYVSTAWDSATVLAEARANVLKFLGKQAAILALVLAAFFIAMRIQVTRPLEALARRIDGIEKGDLDTPVPHGARRDVLGVIAQALNRSIETARQARAHQAEAEEQRRAMDDERARFSQSVQASATRQAEAMARIGEALSRLAQGDFGAELGDLGEDFSALRRDFATMVSAVSHTLDEISGVTDLVDGGTIELARAADELSRRTETQAAALEQTAAALEEITQTVSQSSRKADEAGQLIAEAKTSAKSSADIVRNAITAMGRIEQSSSKIGTIISVIDEIAFQTNLLALNAGVEAARAGDAGKGFAVVAQEVRELAQRSANAAKEIKQLVLNSSGEVASGVALVNDTGNALDGIERQIAAVNEAIAMIVTSAREQSTGLSEVNEAIRRMDETTQRNAAMVEETNAACQELENQSRLLKGAVGRFRTAQAGRSVPAARTRPQVRTEPQKHEPAAAMRSQRSAVRGANALDASQWEEF